MEWYEKWPYKQIGFDDVEQKNIKVNMCECCIAFIDIEPDEEVDEQENLPKATMFSDSMVISKEVDEYFSFSDFVQFIAQLQFELLREGVLLRGGIDIGLVYHDDSFIFGSGMISAYLLESKVSKYPRITSLKK